MLANHPKKEKVRLSKALPKEIPIDTEATSTPYPLMTFVWVSSSRIAYSLESYAKELPVPSEFSSRYISVFWQKLQF